MKKGKRKIDFKSNLKEYLGFIKNHKALFAGLIIFTIITESMLILDKFIFKKVMDNAESFSVGEMTASVFSNALLVLAGIFVFILLMRSVGKWMSAHFLIKLDTTLVKEVKQKYFNHLLGLSHKFHSTHKTGSLISRLNRGSSSIESLTDSLVYQFLPLIIQIILVSSSLAFFSFKPAVVLIFITLVFISYGVIIEKSKQKFKLEYNSAEDSEKGFIADIFTNIDSIKFFGKERFIKKSFAGITGITKEKAEKIYNYGRWYGSISYFIIGIGTLFLVYFPINEFLEGKITLGTVVFIYTLYGNVTGNLFAVVGGIRNLYRFSADFQNLSEYGKIHNEIKDRANAKNLVIKDGIVEFRNVTFNYGKRSLFRNFNLKINKNEKIALVGHSGCGKTTLVKLLNRFYDVNSGEILIDGENIKNFKQESLREETGIVPQECILFDDTIYNNIKFANPSASKNEIMQAMKFAQIDQVIKNFPNKENTIVGERGIKLSGGEKQRVSIARAILADKKVLILDEATSALDSETEHEIQKDLQKLLQGRTSIIIAHRLSTIMNADRIIVMKDGKIVQEGKHSELINREGEYKKLWSLQKGGYIK
jgi:ABC-type multidrug transport system fused ATPase/permease subunit